MTDIATIKKNAREELRVTLENYNSHDLLNLRIWFQAEDGTMRPGKQGLALRVHLIPELLEAIQRAQISVFGADSQEQRDADEAAARSAALGEVSE